MIRLDNLTKVFATGQGGVASVSGVTLEVPAGATCVLLGPSGCGKTTTLRMINRLVAPTSGKIYIDGKDTDTVDPVALRRTIGYVIQQIGLFPNMTVAQNIGVTAIAAYIGAGGLGTFITRGISQTDVRQLLTGAITLALLAIVADYSLMYLQRRLAPKGMAVRA